MIALYPGAFKPPHKGHFNVVKNLLTGNYKGVEYELSDYEEKGDDLLKGKESDLNKIEKVIVFIGGGERDGIDENQAKAIWDIYLRYLPGDVSVIVGEKNPMAAAKNYAKENPDQVFYAVTGIRSAQDVPDLRRVSTFKSRDNVKGLAMTNPVDDDKVRASNIRKAIIDGDFYDVADYFPDEVEGKDVLRIINMLKKTVIAEEMKEKVDKIFDAWFTDETVTLEDMPNMSNVIEEIVEEGSSGVPVRQNTPLPSEERADLANLYEKLHDIIDTSKYTLSFFQKYIHIKIKDEDTPRGFDYTPYMSSILEYMIDEGMKITPLPEIKIRRDEAEAANFFGKTAHYNPNDKEVVLYVEGRHPKDIMRSFTHEMVHHMQNLEGRLGIRKTTNTNEDDQLVEIEKEAYLKGNITFRNWEDKCKNMEEGLWANINAKRAKGEKSSHKNSKAYKQAVKAGNKLEKTKK